MTNSSPLMRRVLRVLLIVAIIYIALIIGQPAGLDLVKIGQDIAHNPSAILQQLVIGLANGAIVTIIAMGYTMVYGIIELVNFAHGDVFMLGTFVALSFVALFTATTTGGGLTAPLWAALLGFIPAMLFCGLLNVGIER